MKTGLYIAGVIGVALGLAGILTVGDAQEESTSELTYVASKQCKLCHNKPGEGQQYAAWQAARHSHAFETLLGESALAIAREKGLPMPPSESADCLKCHVTGYDFETKTHPEQLRLEDGVQCGSCHGPGSGHMADGKVLRMNKDADIDVLANIIRPDVNTCLTCHNAENPSWDPAKYTLESGETAGFDFDQAWTIIMHANPKKSTN